MPSTTPTTPSRLFPKQTLHLMTNNAPQSPSLPDAAISHHTAHHRIISSSPAVNCFANHHKPIAHKYQINHMCLDYTTMGCHVWCLWMVDVAHKEAINLIRSASMCGDSWERRVVQVRDLMDWPSQMMKTELTLHFQMIQTKKKHNDICAILLRYFIHVVINSVATVAIHTNTRETAIEICD